MNIQTIAEHKVAIDLLPEKANVLDLGCRNFIFCNEMRRLGHTVYPVDVDLLEGYTPSKDYLRVAITGKAEQRVGIKRTNDPQATSIIEGDEIWTHTIESFSELAKVAFWDLIKMDVESSEKEIIMSMDRPMGTQISIEFHCHTGLYGLDTVKILVDKLSSLGYYAASHELTKQHGLGENFWDSLFILK